MPLSITAELAWPDPCRLILRLAVAFALAIGLSWLAGRALAAGILASVPALLGWIDDSFAVLYLGIDRDVQDTVIRLRVSQVRMLVVGPRVAAPTPNGWLEVTTTVGTMLQPLTIAVGLAAAWPGKWQVFLLRLAMAAGAGILFMVMDIPLTLHAYVWDMFRDHYDPQGFYPLLLLHEAMQTGGRLAVGVLLGMAAIFMGVRGR